MLLLPPRFVRIGFALTLTAAALPLTAAESQPARGWNRERAFEYLETRQQDWAAWKPAQKAGGACISCHTGLSYMLARRVIGESRPRPVERDLVEGVKTRLLNHPPMAMLKEPGVEAVLNLLTLALQRRSAAAALDAAEQVAMKRLWDTQIKEGGAQGSWQWFEYDLHPVESEHSAFYGATLAAMSLSAYPPQDAARHEALRGYLQREASKQPLHNRLALIAFNAALGKEDQRAVLKDLWAKQSSDGGWTTAALGPWAKHDDAPADSGSNSYATGFAAYAARQAGVACSDPNLRRALAWLTQRQDPASGAWHAVSMNNKYDAGSMQSKFMSDAASGFAAAALVSCPAE